MNIKDQTAEALITEDLGEHEKITKALLEDENVDLCLEV